MHRTKSGVYHMKKDDYVKIVAVDGLYRYGYISEVRDRGYTLGISLFNEGESKIAFDAAYNNLTGQESIDYVSILTGIEKRIIPLLAAGFKTSEIAEELSTSSVTVRAQIRTLRLKLQLDDRDQLRALSPALVSKIEKQAEVDAALKAEMEKGLNG